MKEQGGQEDLSRLLLECLFDDMDRNLREMGVGDMGVGKRVKTMSRAAFYGESLRPIRTSMATITPCARR